MKLKFMKIRFSKDLIKLLEKIKRKDKKLSNQIYKQLKLFTKEPKHPSLRTHKLIGKLRNYWSISLTKSLRMVYILLNDDEAYFIAIGKHEEVYK
jgi:addiction module RelE/StbE family toxin